MNNIVKKSHQFVTGRLQLTAREQDFVTLLMKAVKKAADDIKYSLNDTTENFEYERIPTKFSFTTAELAELFQVTPSALYHSLDELTDSLMGKVAYLKNPEKGSFEKAVLFF
ncbi:replication initiation protein [Photobacterium leiognathi]|uniref:replication initiation protein n=1 Tax=Photobacterium leiognathi TaxID=553611 RepID=UPI00273913DF|nr:replication initiation protein [Photobacterium leiognathi]